jgi:hypothetical protein
MRILSYKLFDGSRMTKKQIILTGGRIRTGLIVILVIASFLLSFVIIWWRDAPPIEDDYTVADLRSAQPDCNGSYQLLLSIVTQDINENGAPEIGLTEEDINDLRSLHGNSCNSNTIDDSLVLAHAATIERIWQHAQKGREVFEELDTFAEIADLTEPSMLQVPPNYLANIRYLAFIYDLKARLLLAQGDDVRAVENSALIYSVFCKYSLNTRTLLNKLVSAGGLAISIKLANDIANHPDVSQNAIELLSKKFRPLSPEVASMRNPVIGEYLSFREYFLKGPESKMYRANPLCKLNSTLRLYRNYMLSALVRSEPNYNDKNPNLRVCAGLWGSDIRIEPDGDIYFPIKYRLYNPVGSVLTSIVAPTIDGVFKSQTGQLIQDDLLQIVINKRLGRPVDLKARAYSDEYIINTDKKIIFSPGPDEIPYTDDDIKFQINPDVLNLSSSEQG